MRKQEERKGDRHASHYGQYGFFCRCNPEDLPYARIVQIGWNMGGVGDTRAASSQAGNGFGVAAGPLFAAPRALSEGAGATP